MVSRCGLSHALVRLAVFEVSVAWVHCFTFNGSLQPLFEKCRHCHQNITGQVFQKKPMYLFVKCCNLPAHGLQAIKGSEFEAADLPDADFVYVDMHCYHTWWMSWHHPFGNKNLTDPTRYIQRTYEMLQDMPRQVHRLINCALICSCFCKCNCMSTLLCSS